MIPLNLPALAEAERPFVTRLRSRRSDGAAGPPADSFFVDEDEAGSTFAGARGLIAVDGVPADDLDGDVVLVQPGGARIERILRAGSPHNTLLVTERCDQLCVMCSQPPKKTHDDRFEFFEEACLLAEPDTLIGVSGGEPTLYKDQLCGMMERVLDARPDLEFHLLTNAQHFEGADVERLRNPVYRRVSWGVPLYAPEPDLHDEIVGKGGAFRRLEESLAHLILAGARVELRTVLLSSNLDALPALARHITARLRFIEVWSIMQLENIGFAKNRWPRLYVAHRENFGPRSNRRRFMAYRPSSSISRAARYPSRSAISRSRRSRTGSANTCPPARAAASGRAAAAFSNGIRTRMRWQECPRYDAAQISRPLPDPQPARGGLRGTGHSPGRVHARDLNRHGRSERRDAAPRVQAGSRGDAGSASQP